MSSNLSKLNTIKKKIFSLYYVYKDPKISLFHKTLIMFPIVYIVSPIDLFPDTIWFIGLIDDLIIAPLFLWLTTKLIPKEVLKEAQEKAEKNKSFYKKIWIFLSIFMILWIILLFWLIYVIFKIII